MAKGYNPPSTSLYPHTDHIHWDNMTLKQERLLLAIGGSKNFEWLPDYGYDYIKVPLAPDFSDFRFDSIAPTDYTELPIAIYRKQTLTDPDSRRLKDVYVIEGMDHDHALHELREYLLAQFIQIEDPTN